MSEQRPRGSTEKDNLLRLIFGEVVEPVEEREPLEESQLRHIVEEAVDDILAPLESLEKEVFRMRYQHEFGFGPRLTQVQIGRELNPPLSRWKVGRIERMTTRKLQEIHGPIRRLRDYLE